MTATTTPQKIDPARFFNALKANQVGFFTGIPDSLLKDFCAYVTGHTTPNEHLIAANEGGAIGLATGYYLATGKLPLVYLQNSGIGNAVNPLLSLADPQVYSIPMILLVGWRGEPGIKDEPQHIKQGRVQNALLNAMEIPYSLLDATVTDVEGFVQTVAAQAIERKGPVAIVVRDKTFQSCRLAAPETPYGRLRESAITAILDSLPENAVIVSTTGKTSREVFEYREQRGQDHGRDFLTVGSMGHCSQIALGIALNTDRPVVCLDGDGAAIMHLGAMSIIGAHGPANLYHLVLNNGAHESVGGQPTVGYGLDLVQIARACGYKQAQLIATEHDFDDDLGPLLLTQGPLFLDIRVNQGSRDDLGRPTSTPQQNKDALMRFIGTLND